jgi:hypothetical protein
MNLYLLEVYSPKGHDTVSGFIIRAPSLANARLLASVNCRDEGERIWLDPYASSCTLLTAEGPTKVILRDFHAG